VRIGVNPKRLLTYTEFTETQTGLFAKNKMEEIIMKLVQSLVLAAVLAVPAVSSFAQSNEPLTRAEVKAQLVQIEKAGYNPAQGDNATYPAGIQAAEAKVAAQDGAAATSYGGVANATATSGATRQAATPGLKPVYFGQ
jgi:hypothetical protein